MTLSISHSANQVTGGAASFTSASFTTSVGDMIVAWGTNFVSTDGATPMSDSQGNTWHKLSQTAGSVTWSASGAGSVNLYYAVVASGKSGTTTVTYTFGASTAGGFNIIVITGFTGTATIDQNSAAVKIAGSSISGNFTASDPAVTTTVAAEMLIGTYADPLNIAPESEGTFGQSGSNTPSGSWTSFGTANWGNTWANDIATASASSTGNYGCKWAINITGSGSQDSWGGTATVYDATSGGIWYMAGMTVADMAAVGTCI